MLELCLLFFTLSSSFFLTLGISPAFLHFYQQTHRLLTTMALAFSTQRRRTFFRAMSTASSGMSFALTEEQLALRDAARKYARAELAPLTEECENKNQAVPIEWRRKFASKGFLGINIPEKYGGLGLGNLEAILAMEEL